MSIKHGLLTYALLTLGSVLSANYAPIFDDDLSEIRVVAGETAILPCSVRNQGEHKKMFPTPEDANIIWINPGRILFTDHDKIAIGDARLSLQKTNHGEWNLIIKHVRFNDSGEYMCQINTNPVKIKRVKLFVQVPPHILNEDSSRDMDVEEGDDVTLTCKATGVPVPNITWYRRSLLETDSKEYLNTMGETLVIPDIKRYHSGMYICLANNDVPPAVTRQMEIKVQYPPVVKVLNTRLGQSLGKETILDCSVTSYPRAKVEWMKNDVVIDHSHKYRLELYPAEFDSYTLSLLIQSVNSYDYGDYTCVASNRMGIARATMVLYEYQEHTTRIDYFTTWMPFTTTYMDDEYYVWNPQKAQNRYNTMSDDSQKRINWGDQRNQGHSMEYYNNGHVIVTSLQMVLFSALLSVIVRL